MMKVDFVLVLTRHTGNTNVDATNAPPTPSVCVAMEDTLLAQGIAVVRILQEDVYFDRHNWRTWITKAVAKAEADAEAGAPPRVHLPWRDEYRAGVYRDLRKDRAASVHAWEAHEGVPNIPFHGALISNSNDRSVAKERTGLQGGCRTGSSRREFNFCVFGYGSIFLRNIRVSNHAGC